MKNVVMGELRWIDDEASIEILRFHERCHPHRQGFNFFRLALSRDGISTRPSP